MFVKIALLYTIGWLQSQSVALLCTISWLQSPSVEAIECYSCSNSTLLSACLKTVQCPSDSICYSKFTTDQGKRFYTLGCRPEQHCPLLSPSVDPVMVGRAISVGGTCSECCTTGFCNRQLCHNQGNHCSDQKGYDCATLGSVINICADITHSKTYCRRFCGLCNTIDGGWTTWSEWSSCDVTCGNGTITKSRTCSDPIPADGGSDCSGMPQAQAECSQRLCPVHGGWSLWSEWGSCSTTCDVGLQRRDRSCSNPFPARSGDDCFGDSRDDRLCFPGACANGSWSQWNSWSTCSTSCGGGFKLRTRSCDDPAPSMTGTYCDGDSVETTKCHQNICYDGLVPVLFHAKTLSAVSPGVNTLLRFTTVLTNIGHGYDNKTGVFTAPVNGTYTFDINICVTGSYQVDIRVFKNNDVIGHSHFYAQHTTCNSIASAAILKSGDKVIVKTGPLTTAGQSLYQSSVYENSFRGVRVQ